MFDVPAPKAAQLTSELNPQSLIERDGVVEPAVVASAETHFQFERQGYFCKDSELDGVFNRTVTLADRWKPPA